MKSVVSQVDFIACFYSDLLFNVWLRGAFN